MHHRILWIALAACACASNSTDHHEPASPELGVGGFAPIDWTPLWQGGSGAGGTATNQAGMAGATAVATGGAAMGGAATGGSSVLETAGAAGARTVATGGASFGGATTVLETAGAAGTSPSMAGASGATTKPASGIRVILGATYGSATDESIETMLVLENKSGAVLTLKDLEIQYFIRLAPTDKLVCECIDAICNQSHVGTVRTIYRAANAFISWSFPTFSMNDGRTISLYLSCHMDNGSNIDESTHYSYPFGYAASDPLPNVVVVYRSKVVWGTLPE